MATKLLNRCEETTAVVGTGSATLLGAVTGRRTISSDLADGSAFYYMIETTDGTAFEAGVGTLTAGVVSRDTVEFSSNGGAKVVFAAGTKYIYGTLTRQAMIDYVNAAAVNNNRIIVSSGGALVEASAITTNRVMYADSNGLPTGVAGFTFDGTNVATTGTLSFGAAGAYHTLDAKTGNNAYLSRISDGNGSNLYAIGYVALGTGLSVNTGFGYASQGNRVIAIQYAAAIASAPTVAVANNGAFGWTASATEAYGAIDTTISRSGANAIAFAGAGSTAYGGGATSRVEINKAITAIADNVAKATFTVTIPNAAHSAGGEIVLVGSLGAGGAIGANEASGTVAYDFTITRTAGVNAVVTFSAAAASAIASVAGGAVMTITAAASAIAGAVGATNTFTVDVTIHAVTGASTNHTCLAYMKLLNANASGITVA